MSAADGRPRALRVMLVANDGLSAGHVTRARAIARGLAAVAARRGLEVAQLLATTSDLPGLGANDPLAVVRVPSPGAARRGGLGEEERRRVVREAIAAVAASFGPDLLVVDTFPGGPHGELGGLSLRAGAKRALVRRRVREGRAGDAVVARGLERYDLAVVADDPDRDASLALPIPIVHVPPITLGEARDGATREAARERLSLPAEGRVVLVTSGGGGDAEAEERAAELAARIAEVAPRTHVALAVGPLGRERPASDLGPVQRVRVAPLAPWLAAFDGAFASAGYNTAHELAKAGVPTALFAAERPYDDQAARARRFASAGIAFALEGLDVAQVRGALAWIAEARRPELPAGGALRAAEALLDLACGEAS